MLLKIEREKAGEWVWVRKKRRLRASEVDKNTKLWLGCEAKAGFYSDMMAHIFGFMWWSVFRYGMPFAYPQKTTSVLKKDIKICAYDYTNQRDILRMRKRNIVWSNWIFMHSLCVKFDKLPGKGSSIRK